MLGSVAVYILVNVDDEAVGFLGALSVKSTCRKAPDVHRIYGDCLANKRRLVNRYVKPSIVGTALGKFDLRDFVLVVELQRTVDCSS